MNQTYGMVYYPMFEAILHCSISELWDRNSPFTSSCHLHKDVHRRRFVPYRGLNQTYGAVYYPMIKPILLSSILGLWDSNSRLHLCVIYTKMYIVEGSYLTDPLTRLMERFTIP